MADAQELICYDLRSVFEKHPRLLFCPLCSHPLEQAEIQNSVVGVEYYTHSTASIPGVDTWLFRCPQCGWWALREQLTDYETVCCDEDYLVTIPLRDTQEIPNIIKDIATDDPMPWQKVLRERAYWEHPCPLSAEAAVWLFGRQEARQKGRTTEETITL